MASIDVPLKKIGFGETRRTDNWWVEPLLIFLGYLSFILYANYAVFNPYCANGLPCYEVPGTGYLSPMYSPLLLTEAPTWWPGFVPFSAAMLILWIPAGFRFTCYYYRGAYYKGFWADPLSCSVGEPAFRGKNYRGERKFPLIIQNVHRYFLYLAILFIFLLTYDAWKGMWFDGPNGPETQFGIGVGTLVLVANPILIGMYTFGCHSLRHLIGGRKDTMKAGSVQKSCYDCVSSLNKSHMKWAWISMYYVALVDVYIRLVASGTITDLRIL